MFLLIYFKYLRSRHNYWVNWRCTDRSLNVGEGRTDNFFDKLLQKELVTISVKMKKGIIHTLELVIISFTRCKRISLYIIGTWGVG